MHIGEQLLRAMNGEDWDRLERRDTRLMIRIILLAVLVQIGIEAATIALI